jgi:hypothetical protein
MRRKSLLGQQMNFLKLLMRFAAQQREANTPLLEKTSADLHIDTKELRSRRVVQQSTFAKFLVSFDVRPFRQHRSTTLTAMKIDFRSSPESRLGSYIVGGRFRTANGRNEEID